MCRQPDLAGLAALIADTARARMLTALMGGIALTATELALEAEVAPSTASGHLAKLTAGEILEVEKRGRHRYYRLAGAEVAAMLEELTSAASGRRLRRLPGPADPALRAARVCYDHLAGERGVWLLARLRERHLLGGPDGCLPTPAGTELLARFGLDLAALARSRRTFSRTCLDWSERRHHLGGALGAAILARIFDLGWARRELDGRAVAFSARGERSLRELLG
jgi:DNA-binding transcriptional ArsR family regulator